MKNDNHSMFYLLNEKRDRNTKYYTSMTPSEENIEGYSYMPLKCEVTHVPNEEETFHFSLEKKKEIFISSFLTRH